MNVSRLVIRNYAKRKPWPQDERIDLDPNLVETLKRAASESGKAPIMDVLLRAGADMDETIVQDLPTWESVTSMYGSEPVILGLETCQAFRSNVDLANRWIATGGMQNSGTNLMSDLLARNCYLPFREDNDPWYLDGMLRQVPWGKHNPESWRLKHRATISGNLVPDQTHVLPVIVVKDPYSWMGSMCRNSYHMKWYHTNAHCPNLVATPEEIELVETFGSAHSIPVLMWYEKDKPFDSLAHVWNDWYGGYLDVSPYPRLIVRYEDLLFHAEQVIQEVCSCAGGKMRLKDKLIYKHAPKGHIHKSDTGFIKAVVQYGNAQMRRKGFLLEDLKYAYKHLRSDLMDIFHYQHPPL
jgi:hypothetical protein